MKEGRSVFLSIVTLNNIIILILLNFKKNVAIMEVENEKYPAKNGHDCYQRFSISKNIW